MLEVCLVIVTTAPLMVCSPCIYVHLNIFQHPNTPPHTASASTHIHAASRRLGIWVTNSCRTLPHGGWAHESIDGVDGCGGKCCLFPPHTTSACTHVHTASQRLGIWVADSWRTLPHGGWAHESVDGVCVSVWQRVSEISITFLIPLLFPWK
jgi:hypothetical protein